MTPEELRDARSYAWDYFALHADQRMKLFNFFLVLAGLILGAFPAVRGMAPGTKLVALASEDSGTAAAIPIEVVPLPFV